MKHEVPFYPQHWDLDDWQNMGYSSREEAEYWEGSCCGILCAKMVMNGLRPEAIEHSIKELIDMGVSRGAYSDVNGWSHTGLVEFIQSFEFTAERGMYSPQELRGVLAGGALAIVSIKWAFKNTKTLKERLLFWKKYGGHLAVLVGYEEEGGQLTGFYVHHTSDTPEHNWVAGFVPLKTFSRGYTGRAILIH